MIVSKDKLKTVVIQYLDVDDDITSDCKIIVLPCRNMETANELRSFYKKKFPKTQLMSIAIIDTPIYG